MSLRIRKSAKVEPQRLIKRQIGKPILVPLTTSLYVPGTLADKENVIVDVGTGFYIEKVCLLRIGRRGDDTKEVEHERCHKIL
jgi:hypothetical protein